MNSSRYRTRWLRYLGQYEKTGSAIMRSALVHSAMNIDFDSLAKATYPAGITVAIKLSDINQAYVDLYGTIGAKHGNIVSKGILKESKERVKVFSPISFKADIARWIQENNVNSRIVLVQSGMIKHLIGFIAIRLQAGVPMDVIVNELRKYILSRRFYDWQIERIVRTEVLSAANYGASRASETSGVRTNKVWISARDNRVRRIAKGEAFDHWEMHEVQVAEGERFSVPRAMGGTEQLRFPGDPLGSASNVINCRCVMAPVPVRDARGELVYTDGRLNIPSGI